MGKESLFSLKIYDVAELINIALLRVSEQYKAVQYSTVQIDRTHPVLASGMPELQKNQLSISYLMAGIADSIFSLFEKVLLYSLCSSVVDQLCVQIECFLF